MYYLSFNCNFPGCFLFKNEVVKVFLFGRLYPEILFPSIPKISCAVVDLLARHTRTPTATSIFNIKFLTLVALMAELVKAVFLFVEVFSSYRQ